MTELVIAVIKPFHENSNFLKYYTRPIAGIVSRLRR